MCPIGHSLRGYFFIVRIGAPTSRIACATPPPAVAINSRCATILPRCSSISPRRPSAVRHDSVGCRRICRLYLYRSIPRDVVGLEGGPVGYVLFCWGASAFVGLFLGGTINDKIGARRAISIALPLMAISLASLSITAAYAGLRPRCCPVSAAVAVWDNTAWGFFPPQQARLIGIAGLKKRRSSSPSTAPSSISDFRLVRPWVP